MGRSPCCSKEGLNRGAWTALEDKILKDYITLQGEGKWRNLPKRAGLMRCGKSCRLRWLNYLRPDIKRGNISHDEEELIIRLHKLLGNRWSLIAGRLPGRTDNEIKNYWNTNLCKKLHTHQNSSVAKKNSNQSGHDKRKSKSNNMDPHPKKESSNVVRTKAVRCSKVIINHPQPNMKTDHQPMAKPLEMVNVQEAEDNNTSRDFALDANMEDVWLSDFLNSEELLMPCEDTMEDWSGNNFLEEPNLNYPHGLTSFLGYGGDWLADN
ncbi:hypothetical protein Vadar_034082 [Vaccinium darrowii]|uniref:Uncharacterized protein n=1 Tax=Vaccinium darrowii TaxID=229202 RepID=A0ACB7YRF7_9ERIC|nr:hypothetical protein Vadar_034082 [Vaccinium darrowii]